MLIVVDGVVILPHATCACVTVIIHVGIIALKISNKALLTLCIMLITVLHLKDHMDYLVDTIILFPMVLIVFMLVYMPYSQLVSYTLH